MTSVCLLNTVSPGREEGFESPNSDALKQSTTQEPSVLPEMLWVNEQSAAPQKGGHRDGKKSRVGFLPASVLCH